MGQGHEFLQRVHDALSGFEDAVVQREHKKLLESKVPLQQQVDRARGDVVKVVVDIVTQARLEA